MKILFPGSFNPFHIGHKNIVDKIALLFPGSDIHVVKMKNPKKYHSESSYNHELSHYYDTINWSGTVCEYVLENDIDLIVRGIRSPDDVTDDEEWLNYISTVCPNTDVIYLKSDDEFKGISSTKLRINSST